MHSKLWNAAAWSGFIALSASILTVGLVGGRKADATPALAKKEKKPCSYCHVNPSGGGKNNATGKWYKAHGNSFAGYTPEKAAAEFGGAAAPAPTPTPKPAVKPAAKPTAKPAAKGKAKPAAKPAPKPTPKKK